MKVLLIGWDGADWSALETLLGQGLMPRLAELASRRRLFELAPAPPLNAAALWTSLATGQRAWRHGVLMAAEVNETRSATRAVSRRSLRAAPVWSMLSAAGRQVQTYGWPATHPAETLSGIVVSDQFADFGEASSVYPPECFEALRQFRLEPTDIDAASLLALVPRAGELSAVGDQRLYLVARFLASIASLHAAATWGLEHMPWDFAAVRYDGLSRLRRACHGEADGVFDDVLTNAYRFFDMMLGRLLELADAETVVMLVAGGSSREAARMPRGCLEPWRVIVRSRGSIADFGELATLCDLTPAILRLFGAAPRSSNEQLRSSLTRLRESYENEDAEEDESIAHLVELGYREPPDLFLPLAIEELASERQRRLAESQMANGEYARAASVLAEVLTSEPRSAAVRSMLAEAYFRIGKYDDCRQLVLEMRADGLDTPLARIALAALDLLRGAGEPLAHLQRAETLCNATAPELTMIGQLYLGLRRRTDAARVLDAAVAAAPRIAAAHASRALAHLYAGDAVGAEASARTAIACGQKLAAGQYSLGLALAKQERLVEAVHALKAGLALDRSGDGWAHGRLADLYERQQQHALAAHHRAVVDRCYRNDRRRTRLNLQWLSEGLL